MHYEGGLHKGSEVEELAGAGLPLLGSTQQCLCLCCVLTLHSPAPCIGVRCQDCELNGVTNSKPATYGVGYGMFTARVTMLIAMITVPEYDNDSDN